MKGREVLGEISNRNTAGYIIDQKKGIIRSAGKLKGVSDIKKSYRDEFQTVRSINILISNRGKLEEEILEKKEELENKIKEQQEFIENQQYIYKEKQKLEQEIEQLDKQLDRIKSIKQTQIRMSKFLNYNWSDDRKSQQNFEQLWQNLENQQAFPVQQDWSTYEEEYGFPQEESEFTDYHEQIDQLEQDVQELISQPLKQNNYIANLSIIEEENSILDISQQQQ